MPDFILKSPSSNVLVLIYCNASCSVRMAALKLAQVRFQDPLLSQQLSPPAEP